MCGPFCPFGACAECDYKGGETVVAQEDSARDAIDWDSKTAPGVASTNTGSLAHSEAAKPHGRTCI